MQLCLDGKDPLYHEEHSDSNGSFVHDVSDNTTSIVGPKGMKGIKNYLKIDTTSLPLKVNDNSKNVAAIDSNRKSNLGKVLHMSPSYADRVSALLNTPPIMPEAGNKENKSLCNEIKGDNGSEQKLARKRSLTEMIGHNPLSKERKPLGQRRCFETDL